MKQNKKLIQMLVENLNGRGNQGHLIVDGRIILKCMFDKQGVKVWTGFNLILNL
jgi:hypothetical protein